MVGALLEVVERDAKLMRVDKPFIFTNLKTGDDIEKISLFIQKNGMLEPCAN